MAIGQVSQGNQSLVGIFGAASVGAGLRVGLGTIQSSEEALIQIAEAREAAAVAARERAEQARRDAENAANAERNRLGGESARQPEDVRAADRAQTVQRADAQASEATPARTFDDAAPAERSGVNQAPAADAAATGRGGLFDLSV
jgi:phage repressor protein C with HTH and peptisase S24 domain